MTEYRSMGEAEGAAMAHNARMAADLARLTKDRSVATPEPAAVSVPPSATRLTDQQLAAWASRLTDITEGPWLVASDDYGNPVIYVERESNDGSATALLLLAGAAATEADVQFMTHSPERIAALLAEVDRLRAELTERTEFIAEVNYQRERALGDLSQARSAAFTEAARVIETLGHDDDAVAVLDNIAASITTYAAPASALGAGQ